MNSIEFARRAKAVASMKTTYLMGGFGCRLGLDWYNKDYAWNKEHQRSLESKYNADPRYFGFDCVCLIKGILWGFTGDYSKEYGGSVYKSNGVPDVDISTLYKSCTITSDDFNSIEVGEIVFLKKMNHVGIYIGDGEVVESTPAWKNGVQRTLLPSRNSSNYEKLPVRAWDYHGAIPYVTYVYTNMTEPIWKSAYLKLQQKYDTLRSAVDETKQILSVV